MKEFVNKLIGRLDEIYNRNNKQKKEAYEEQEWERFDFFTHRNEGIYIAMAIVNKLAEEYNNDFCEWKFMKTVVAYFYSSGCNHKRFSDLHGFEFCPYCGKKIKVVK